MKQLNLFLVAIFTIIVAACGPKKQLVNEENTVIEKTTDKDCPKDIICTMDYRTITVTIKDKNGQSITLDKYTSDLKGTAKSLIRNNATESISDSYIIAADNAMNIVGKNGKEVEFIGYKNGKEVVRRTFKIGHDCCHIKLLEGETEIIVE